MTPNETKTNKNKRKTKMKFINLTPHAVKVVLPTGEIREFPSEGVVRLETKKDPYGDLDGIPLVATRFGKVEGMPEKLDRAACYIVSALAKDSFRNATSTEYEDHENEGIPFVVSPGELVRDDKGNVIGCREFSL